MKHAEFSAEEQRLARSPNSLSVKTLNLDLSVERSAAKGTAHSLEVPMSRFIYNAPLPSAGGVFVSLDAGAHPSNAPSNFYLSPGAARTYPFNRLTVENSAQPGKFARLEYSARVELGGSADSQVLSGDNSLGAQSFYQSYLEGISRGYFSDFNLHGAVGGELYRRFYSGEVIAFPDRLVGNMVWAGGSNLLSDDIVETARNPNSAQVIPFSTKRIIIPYINVECYGTIPIAGAGSNIGMRADQIYMLAFAENSGSISSGAIFADIEQISAGNLKTREAAENVNSCDGVIVRTSPVILPPRDDDGVWVVGCRASRPNVNIVGTFYYAGEYWEMES